MVMKEAGISSVCRWGLLILFSLSFSIVNAQQPGNGRRLSIEGGIAWAPIVSSGYEQLKPFEYMEILMKVAIRADLPFMIGPCMEISGNFLPNDLYNTGLNRLGAGAGVSLDWRLPPDFWTGLGISAGYEILALGIEHRCHGLYFRSDAFYGYYILPGFGFAVHGEFKIWNCPLYPGDFMISLPIGFSMRFSQ
jgi:hypothetical protein